MKHIHETSAFLIKSGILRTSVYNVYGSQNEFVVSVTRVFILHMRNLGQNGPLRRNNVFAVARIKVWSQATAQNVQIVRLPVGPVQSAFSDVA